VLTVWKRDQLNRRIGIECPACGLRLVVADPVLAAIEDGVVVIVRCLGAECRTGIEVDLAALGGYLWAPPRPNEVL